MSPSKISILLVFLLLAAVFCAAAGCVEPKTPDVRIQSLNQILDNSSVGEIKEMYLGFVDEKSGKSWWVSLKNKVGSSVLSAGPDADKIEAALTGEKAHLVGDSLEFIGIDKRLGYYSLEKYEIEELKNLTRSHNIEEWTKYSLTHLPTPVYHSATLSDWKSYLPILKKVLNNLSTVRVQYNE